MTEVCIAAESREDEDAMSRADGTEASKGEEKMCAEASFKEESGMEVTKKP